MMNGVATLGKTSDIKKMLKQGMGVLEIAKITKLSRGHVSLIKHCLNNDMSTAFHHKLHRQRHPEKRKKERKENYVKGAKYDFNSRMSYSKQEEEIIIKSKETDRELAKKMSRSVKAIQVKRAKMKKESELIVENIPEPAQFQSN